MHVPALCVDGGLSAGSIVCVGDTGLLRPQVFPAAAGLAVHGTPRGSGSDDGGGSAAGTPHWLPALEAAYILVPLASGSQSERVSDWLTLSLWLTAVGAGRRGDNDDVPLRSSDAACQFEVAARTSAAPQPHSDLLKRCFSFNAGMMTTGAFDVGFAACAARAAAVPGAPGAFGLKFPQGVSTPGNYC